VVIRLYSEEDYNARSEFTDPEILRTNLASVILQSAAIGIDDIAKFPFLQAPDPRGVRDGLGLLTELGALEQDSKQVKLTPLGRELARLPIEPRFARMLLEARTRDLVREVMVIVSGLTIQDPRERPLEKRVQADTLHARFVDQTSDFLTLLNLYNYIEDKQKELSSSAFRRLCKAEYLNYLRVREWQDLMHQLRSLAKPLGLNVKGRKKDPEGIHKCLLSGLLSQIGIKQPYEKKVWQNGKEKPNRAAAEYAGAGGKKFVIFPGSALAKKPPEAIISAELVETSRLFARMNAEILPEWAEQLAGDLAKRSFAEPHWEKKQGAVVALERVTLFGLPIVVGRKMQYSRVEPMLCRELFIRHALVEGDWDSQQQFDRDNRQLIKELEAQAERARKPELAPGENEIFRFYNNRIPLDVLSTRSFEGWWKKAKHETPNLLTMTKQNLLEVEVVELSDEDLPTQWSYDGQQFNLSYRFDPGAIDDGVTVDVPVAVLAGLQQDPFEWLVPGMRLELVTELIRSLPKNIRKNVVPANDWAKKALSELPEVPTGALLTLLAKTLQNLSGTVLSASDFDSSKLPSAMRMTYRVVDENGKQLGLSDDLSALKTQLRDKGRGAVAKAVQVESTIERTGITTWDFDSIPDLLESEVAGNLIRGFPSLVTTPKGCDLKLFPTQSERERNHIWGVIALVHAAIPTPAKYIAQHLSQQEKLSLVSLGYKDTEHFVRDLIAAMSEQEIRKLIPSGVLLHRADFEKVRDVVAAAAIEKAFEVAGVLVRIASAAAEATKAISAVKTIDLLPILSFEKDHMAQLLTANLVSSSGLDRLARLPIYLKAIAVRITKLAENPAKDVAPAAELAAALRVYTAAGGQLPLQRNASSQQQAGRWLLEEFRVSLFAQSLGTAAPVSLQRIEKVLSK
jgi:ATP-dependent helicase HrpA